ncbi:hypothetical protein AURANDRAFT_61478 [Aureococcus anophagefferens]|uniref:Uncharacterized protein n=1 Tax=Aureococcus anophagefferens TaxID=44056 RepID=F0XYK9_AURAN|nr:hypothetical protein AURANDRAFT_61478 [Aureococcus anophagefferens]EGB12155.1 hypothetical protein AURANDRAFT_61478 [Aureococcus anophagefferens]|eukprot:XP_009033236.1 hypothetical protein AURANDRAFT_61478 [Aureococcus anophagefferens]
MAAVVAAAGAMGDVGTKFVVTASNEVGGGSAKFVLKKWAAVDSTPACSRGVGDELEVVELDGSWMRAKATAASKGGWFSSEAGGYAVPAAPEAPAARTRGPEITLKVMHPEHKDHKVMTVEVYADTPVVDLKATNRGGKRARTSQLPRLLSRPFPLATICRETGLKEKPLLPVKKYNSGPVDDDHKAMMESRLKDYVNWIPCDAKDTVRDVGYANGDAFAFTYLGTAQDDLKEDLKWIAPMYSDSDDDDSDHEWTYEKYVAQQRGSGGAGVISDRPGAAAAAGGDADFMDPIEPHAVGTSAPPRARAMTTAHAIAFCAGPLIVALLLAISGAFTQSAKTAARPPHAHVAFTSRFGARLSGNAHSLLLVCLMAALAECWNSVVTPDLGSVLGVELQGTLLNLSGAALGGFAAVLAAHGGRRGALWSAFNDGFVAAYTSFVFFVVHAAELAARGAGDPSTSAKRDKETVDLSTPYLLGCLLLGPAFHLLGRRAALAAFPPPAAPPPGDAAGLAAPLAALLAAALARECAAGPGRGAALAFGCAVTALACVAGELVGHLVHEGEVNWGTAFANAVALCVEINQ